jgi:glycosyltransferase involved in cell wall biosynthesis
LKVSVIIPVYNAEKYIRACLLSVMRQTYRKLEIIVIDDGSEDKSFEITRKLKKADKRIRLFRQQNQGVSAARNTGLDKATGRYVFFVDSDDVIHPRLIETLIEQAEFYHAELIFCTYVKLNSARIDKIAGREKLCPISLRNLWITGERNESLEWFHKRYSRELSCIGGKLIQRLTIGEVRFDETLSMGEDTVFLYHICKKQVAVSCFERGWYYYRQHKKNVTASYTDAQDIRYLRAYRTIRDEERKNGRISWALEWEYRYVWKILSEYLTAKNKKRTERSSILKEMITTERRQTLYRKLSVRTRMLFDVLYVGCTYVPPVRSLWLIKQKICKRKV